jgi:hypothetical protein
MMIKVSKDQTALVGFSGRIFNADKSFAEIKNLTVFMRDDENRIKFDIEESIRKVIVNKGYFIYFQDVNKSLDMIKVNVS